MSSYEEYRIMAAFCKYLNRTQGYKFWRTGTINQWEDAEEAHPKEFAEWRETEEFAKLAGLPWPPPPKPSTEPKSPKATTVTTLCIAAQKGGAGKTTLAQCLAVEALRQGMPAAIIDTDPQQSAFKWGARREERDIDAPAVVTVGAQPVKQVAAELADRGAQIILIDTPPHAAATINAALEVANAAIMVTRPNPMDLESLGATWAIVQRMRLPTATIFTQVPPGERARALRLGQGLLDELGISYCPTPLSYTLSYPYAQAEALAVQEREPTSKARAEVAEVWSWLRRSGIM